MCDDINVCAPTCVAIEIRIILCALSSCTGMNCSITPDLIKFTDKKIDSFYSKNVSLQWHAYIMQLSDQNIVILNFAIFVWISEMTYYIVILSVYI